MGDPRLFFVNFTSSLVAVNTTLLAYVGAAAVALYYLYLESQSSSSYGSYGSNAYSQSYNYARSNDDGYDLYNGLNIIQWISMLQDIYEKFDYNDLDCQKRP